MFNGILTGMGDFHRDLILASRSPRRTALLRMIGVSHTVQEPVGEEVFESHDMIDEARASDICRQLATDKARGVAANNPGRVVLGADTIVVVDGRLFGKPADTAEARRMLHELAGRTHRVYTGICLIRDDISASEVVSTAVTFYPPSDEMSRLIEDYLASGAPLDKAGAYGIQDFGSLLIEGIEGDYYNVVGLPLASFWRLQSRLRLEKGAIDEKSD